MFLEIIFIGCAVGSIVASINSRRIIKLRNAPTMDICKRCKGLTRGDVYCIECNQIDFEEYKIIEGCGDAYGGYDD